MDKSDKEKIKASAWSVLWGVGGGAIATIIIGFAWGGWVLGSDSLNMGKEMAEVAVVERLASICVAQFDQDPQKDAKLILLKEKSSWDSGGYVKAQGWATMPFEKDTDSRVVARCSELIMKNSQ